MAAASAPVHGQQLPADNARDPDPELGHTAQAASAASTLPAVFGCAALNLTCSTSSTLVAGLVRPRCAAAHSGFVVAVSHDLR